MCCNVFEQLEEVKVDDVLDDTSNASDSTVQHDDDTAILTMASINVIFNVGMLLFLSLPRIRNIVLLCIIILTIMR